jgi:hypothetical protein
LPEENIEAPLFALVQTDESAPLNRPIWTSTPRDTSLNFPRRSPEDSTPYQPYPYAGSCPTLNSNQIKCANGIVRDKKFPCLEGTVGDLGIWGLLAAVVGCSGSAKLECLGIMISSHVSCYSECDAILFPATRM